ncbi:MAG: type II secretion system F family protein [archaeon]
MLLYKWLSMKMPELSLKLKEAKMPMSSEEYIRRTWKSAMMLSIAMLVVFFFFSGSIKVILFFPIVFPIMFLYFLKLVDVKIEKMRKSIEKEILFAGRFLIIELESGVPIYNAFKNISKNYEAVGPFFQEIVYKVDLGTSLEDALNEVIVTVPSPNLVRILWQILNSFKTGSNVTGSLNTVLTQIAREQQIIVKEYGRKLNPLAMFYMMMAIIVPSLGITMLSVFASFIGLNISLGFLLVIWVVLMLIQFMFLAMIKSSRPPMIV